MNKIKNSIILLMAIVLSFSNNVNTTIVKAKDNKNNQKNVEEVKDIKLTKLYNNSAWKTLSQVWKELNKNKEKNNYDLHSYSKLSAHIDKFAESIKELRAQGLINKVQLNFLNQLFTERFNYLKYKMGFIKCYNMSKLGMEVVNRRDDLEERYDVIEQLYKEDKINTETYEKTKEQIIQDLQFIDQNSEKTTKEYSDSQLIDLLLDLNK